MKKRKRLLEVTKFTVANLTLGTIIGGLEKLSDVCEPIKYKETESPTCTRTFPKSHPKNPCTDDNFSHTV